MELPVISLEDMFFGIDVLPPDGPPFCCRFSNAQCDPCWGRQ